ncbi:probable disease resistance protein At5g45490 [Herrania umbratica]|uniref:Probable disease resistance protein At5g45490 n=1 Tax=Herrania umbratica TaxID=108875 RepID=A0A6J1A494_9ROSI|nr:probable disease resistance protein At5g45490 [Herrania umbratica]XP_021281660.1 probable disease resistance protein At5g45490 [Herrania umbratica]
MKSSVHPRSNTPSTKALYDQFLDELSADDETSSTFRIPAFGRSKSPSTGSTDDSNKGEKGASEEESIASPRRMADTKEFLEKIYEPVGRSKVHGFDYDIMSLKMLLLDERSQYSFKVVGVVGMLGVGKTTLCRLILDEEEVKQRFVPRFWITMPTDEEPNSMEKVVERMLERLGVEEEIITSISINHELPGLLYALHLYVRGKRYLILLDGVRAKDKYYENLMSCLRDGHGFPTGYGGAVMVTSRDEEAVKNMVGEQNLHRLLPLSNPDSCWPIYQNLDSAAQDSGSEASKEVKDELLKKCGGLPLAARILRELKDLEKKQGGGSKEGPIQAPAASKEVSSQAPAASKEGPIQASTASNEVSSQASAASKEVSSQATAASKEGPIQASAVSEEGPIQAPAASKEVSSQAPAASKENSTEASAPSIEDLNEASAVSKEGSNEASAASKVVSSQASTASKEGSNQASTASNESDLKPATTN